MHGLFCCFNRRQSDHFYCKWYEKALRKTRRPAAQSFLYLLIATLMKSWAVCYLNVIIFLFILIVWCTLRQLFNRWPPGTNTSAVFNSLVSPWTQEAVTGSFMIDLVRVCTRQIKLGQLVKLCDNGPQVELETLRKLYNVTYFVAVD